jgi:hypothetical protein
MSGLPKVASNIHIVCKKCAQDRYHRVLAHVDDSSIKVECEVCHSKRTHKINEGNENVKAAKSATKAKKTSKRAPRGPSATEVQNARFKELLEKMGDAKPQPYRMANVYQVDAKIEHPKFGLGFVAASLPDKIEVVFEDLNRSLVQGRK